MFAPRPLVSPSAASSFTDLQESELMDLVDEGLIPAFNIAARLDSSRREIRLLSIGLIWYAGAGNLLPVDMNQVCEAMIAPDAETTTATLPRTLNCSPRFLLDLIHSGAFSLAHGQTLSRGKGNAAIVQRDSVLKFLKSRLL